MLDDSCHHSSITSLPNKDKDIFAVRKKVGEGLRRAPPCAVKAEDAADIHQQVVDLKEHHIHERILHR